MVEHFLGKEEVAGPIPTIGSNRERVASRGEVGQYTNMKFLRLILIFSTAVIIVGSVFLLYLKSSDKTVETPVVTVAEKPAPVPLKVTVQGEETYVCERKQCVKGGEWKYFYDEGENHPISPSPRTAARIRGTEESNKVYLRRSKEGTTETIMESTPLTRPRDLFVSPNNQHVVFWLDNVAEPEAELTELWIYDVEDRGVRLLAEKIYRPDVRSKVFWNSAGTHLWFIADTGPQTAVRDQLELVVVNANAPGIRAVFPEVSWADVAPKLEEAHVELSQRADRLVYGTHSLLGKPVLAVHTPTGAQRTSLRGNLRYSQWVEDDSLLYALQDERGFTLWRMRNNLHQFIVRREGELASAQSDSGGEHLVFAARNTRATTLYSLHVASGALTEVGQIPASDHNIAINWVEKLPAESPAPGEDVTASLDDAELVAVIDKNLSRITGDPQSTPLRLIVTDRENTLFLDYRQPNGEERRLQIKVFDAVNTEWSITARYEPVNREWKKVQGGGLADPKPLRLYEWEETLNQWVLKERLTADN